MIVSKTNPRPINIDLDDENEILLNCGSNEPYLSLNQLLIIKSKIEKSIQFAIDNDIEGLNKWHKAEEYRRSKLTTRDGLKKVTNVYLMIDHNTGFYKIGRSKSPLDRERTLQSEKPTIELLCYWQLVENEERALHDYFAEKRVRGEWFALDKEDIEFITSQYEYQTEEAYE